MSEKKRRQIKGHRLRKKVLRVIIGVLLAILFLEFILYFGSNFLLANWARRKVNEATSEVYTIDFNRLNVSLIRRGVFVDGIVMKPNPGVVVDENKTLFNFSLDELALKGSWYSFSDNIFYLGKLEFDNPNVRLSMGERPKEIPQDTTTTVKESPVSSLEREIKKTISKTNLEAFWIREIEIRNADLFFLNFLSDNSLKVENSKLLIKEVNLSPKQEWTTPFNAAGFEFEMESGEFLLPDKVHKLTANRIFISSLDQVIDLESFRMSADRSKENKIYYDVELDRLLLKEVDLNKAFLTSDLEIEEIVLNAPAFKVARQTTENKTQLNTGDLNELIDGIMNSVQVSELSINRGSFISSDPGDSLKNRIELADLEFKMIEFYLGKDEEKKKNQFFYGQDAAMSLGKVKLYLSDGVHRIEGDRVSVNSFTDDILVEGFKITPRDSSNFEELPKTLLKIQLPELKMSDASLKRLYNDGILDVDEIVMDAPKVEIIENQVLADSDGDDGRRIGELLRGFLTEFKVKSFDLNDGVVNFSNSSGIRNSDVDFDRFSVLLEDIRIAPEEGLSTMEYFLANEIVLDLDNYRIRLRDNLHEFTAGKVIIDSKEDRIELRDFKVTPPDSSRVGPLLDLYDKTAVVNLDVPYFAAEGIDLRKAFFEEELDIGLINIPSSSIRLDRFEKRKRTNSGELSSENDLSELLTQYFKSIKIDSLNFLEGDLAYQNFSGDKPITISEDDLSIALKNFYVERGKDQDPNQTFFSDEIDINFKDYSFSLAGGNYKVNTNNIRYNSLYQRIDIENLELIPSTNLESKVALSLIFPELVMDGVNIDRFLFENVLDLEKLQVVGSTFNLEINPEIKRVDSLESSGPNQGATLPQAIDRISIGLVEADQSLLQLDYLIGEEDVQSIETKFDLMVRGFDLDSISSTEENISSLFDQITINLQDFSFALPDSVHTLRFSDVDLNTETDESVFRNFEIIPRSVQGNPGKPVVAANIAAVSVQNNKLANILGTRTFHLDQIKLTEPNVKVYLDEKEDRIVTKSPPRKEVNEKGLITSLVLNDLLVEEGKVQVFSKKEKPLPALDFEGLNMGLRNLDFELLRQKLEVTPEFFLERDFEASLRNYTLFTKDSLNRIDIGDIKFDGENLLVSDVWFRPNMGRYRYLKTIGFQSDAIEAKLDNLSVLNIDFPEFANQGKLKAEDIIVDGLDLDVFRDKRLPLKDSVIRPMPQELLMSSPFGIEVDSLLIENSRVRYQEFVPKGLLVGTLTFDSLNASLVPFIAVQDSVDYPVESSFLLAKALIEGEGDVQLATKMDFSPPYVMDVDVRLGEFDLTKANPMLQRTSFIGITSGKVSDGRWKFKINEDEAWGRMRFYYEDLKVALLDSVTLEPGRGKLALYSFLANTALKNKNPRGLLKKKVSKRIYFERDKSKFIFNGWWKATFSGLKGAVGLGQAKIPARKEDEYEDFE